MYYTRAFPRLLFGAGYFSGAGWGVYAQTKIKIVSKVLPKEILVMFLFKKVVFLLRFCVLDKNLEEGGVKSSSPLDMAFLLHTEMNKHRSTVLRNLTNLLGSF